MRHGHTGDHRSAARRNADGVKTTATSNLIFTHTSKALALSADPLTGASMFSGVQDTTLTYRTTDDPNVIVATLNGTDVTLTWDGVSSYTNADGSISATPKFNSADGQVAITTFGILDTASSSGFVGYLASGLTTDPAQVAALAAASGSANYIGSAQIGVVHGTAVSSASFSGGTGTATLTADFGASTVSGSMTVSDDGSSSPGFAIAPGTVIAINPATISGNAFSGTWSVANPANLNLSSVSATGVSGNFFGVGAADIGGTFNGSGISADGTTPAYIIGGFFGQ